MSAETADALLADVLLKDHGEAGPYDAYRRLRSVEPAHLTPSGVLVLSGYDDCAKALRSRDLGKADESLGFRLAEVPDDLQRRAMRRFRATMLFSNPPDHHRLRRLVSEMFSHRHVDEMKQAIEARVDQLLDRVEDASGAVDLMTHAALPLPVGVIGDLLGLPEGGGEWAAPLVRDLIAPLEPSADAQAFARAVEAEDQLAEYLGAIIDERRRDPGPDLLSRLATARDTDALDRDECIGTAILLFAAGFETTTNLIGNGVHAILRRPEQYALLRRSPDLLDNAVEELLRFDAPVQTNGRTVMQPVTIAGRDLSPGMVVLTLLGAANHDPNRHDRADDLDVTRRDPSPISFGAGMHFCLGASLARLEGRAFFGRLIERFPTLTLSGEPTWRRGLSFRGLESLPVEVR